MGFNWYYAIFPQLEQNAIYNSVNFSMSPMNACQYSAAVTKVNALLCPSESATLQLYPSTYLGVTGGNTLAVSNYVGNYGGPAGNNRIQERSSRDTTSKGQRHPWGPCCR